MKKVCIIGVYFGKFPSYMNMWLLSVENNPTIDFLVLTDQKLADSIPNNLRILPFSLSEFKKLAEKKIGMKIRCDSPYKLCDYKPLYGFILDDYISDYDYWGECDFDVVFGDLRFFFNKYELYKYDKFLNRGHLTLYRNTKEVNSRFKLKGGAFGSYKEIFRSDMVWGLDEMYGINRIYAKHNFSCFDEFIIADIDMRYRDMRLVPHKEEHLQNYDNQIFYWENGKVFREYLTEERKVKQEFAYIHLAKRKFERPDINGDTLKVYITPDGFVAQANELTENSVFSLNEKDKSNTVVRKQKTSRFDKKMKFFWIGRRYLNLKHKLKSRGK